MRPGPKMGGQASLPHRLSAGLRHKATASTCSQEPDTWGWWSRETLRPFPSTESLGRGWYESRATGWTVGRSPAPPAAHHDRKEHMAANR